MEDSKPYGISRRQALGLVGMSMAVIATTSVQAYDPPSHLYDYAQTKAATTNYVKSLAAAPLKITTGKSISFMSTRVPNWIL
jgi:NAD(P)-dependent dehydrogenase (short-subunit alcohol dehydrogenase family)